MSLPAVNSLIHRTALALTAVLYSVAASAQNNDAVSMQHRTATPVSIGLVALAALGVVALIVTLFQLVRFRNTGRTRDA